MKERNERTPRTDLENELADKEFAKRYREARIETTREIQLCDRASKKEGERIIMCALQAITDEPEYPDGMPDELWQELDGNRDNVEKAMRSLVRLTKKGITNRFINALSSI